MFNIKLLVVGKLSGLVHIPEKRSHRVNDYSMEDTEMHQIVR